MAKTRFINPLFQKTETPRPQPAATQDADIKEEEQPLAEPTPISDSVQSTFLAPDPEAAADGRSPARRPARAATPAPVSRRAPAAAAPSPAVDDEAPVKFTFYFSPTQLRQLDDLWIRAKTEHNQKISKSEFVRVAVARLLEDFDKNPERVLRLLKRGR